MHATPDKGDTMKTGLSDFIADVNRSRKSGLLSITVKGANSLLKLFFRGGEIYHMTYGNAKGSPCLAQVAGTEFAEYSFMPDVALSVQDEELPSIEQVLSLFRGTNGATETAPHPGIGSGRPAPAGGGGAAAIQEGIKLALIRQIGPAGAKVMAKAVEQNLKSAAPGRDELLRLVDQLKNEIENPNDRNAFINEAKALIP